MSESYDVFHSLRVMDPAQEIEVCGMQRAERAEPSSPLVSDMELQDLEFDFLGFSFGFVEYFLIIP